MSRRRLNPRTTRSAPPGYAGPGYVIANPSGECLVYATGDGLRFHADPKFARRYATAKGAAIAKRIYSVRGGPPLAVRELQFRLVPEITVVESNSMPIRWALDPWMRLPEPSPQSTETSP